MSRFSTDSTVRLALQLVSSVAILIVGLIFAFLIVESRSAIEQIGWRLFSDASWGPAEFADQGTFGLAPIMVGTLLVSLGAIGVTAPLGIASAIFSQFYAPPSIAFLYRRLIELLVGIPSVVFGFWGLVVLCPFIATVTDRLGGIQVPGPSLLSAIIIVAMMILPTVMLISESAIKRVPKEFVIGAAAAGIGRFSIVMKIVLPQSKSGIVTGVVLALARALGETMAVVMVAGNIVKIPGSLFDPVRTLTANIALEMGYAVGAHRSALFFSGLLLMAVVAILFALEIYLRRCLWRKGE